MSTKCFIYTKKHDFLEQTMESTIQIKSFRIIYEIFENSKVNI